MYGLGVNKLGVTNKSGFVPSTLFASGEEGAWYDPSDLSTLFADSYGTTPATVGNPVGIVLDKSKKLETQSIDPSGTGGTATYTAETKTVVFDRNGNFGTISFPATVGEVFRISGTVTIADTATSLKDSANPSFPTVAVFDSFGTYDFDTYFTCLTQDDIVLYVTDYGAGSSAVTIAGLTVEKVLGNHAIQETSAKRPTLRESNNLYYLEFNGAQALQTPINIDLSSGDSLSVFTAARKEDDLRNQNIIEFSNAIGSNQGACRVFCNSSNLWASQFKGTTANSIFSSSVGADDKSILVGVADISSPSNLFRRNGSQVGFNTNNIGTGNFGNHPLNIGARNDGAGAQLEGEIYGIIFRNVVSNNKEIESTEKYLANKSGVTL